MAMRPHHIYITASMRDGLAALHARTRITLAHYMREAVDDLLARYQSGARADPLPTPSPGALNAQCIIRLRPEQSAELKKLVERTRIRESVLLREALDDLLEKYKLPGAVVVWEAA